MDPARPKLPHLNLPKHQATQLDLYAVYPWTEQVAELFGPLVSERRFISGTPYTAGRRKHLITILVWQTSEEEPRLVVRVTYDATERIAALRIPDEDRREEEFLSRILAISESLPIGCTTEFLFPPMDASAMWFPLPSRIGGTSDSPELFEIRGIRGAKLTHENAGPHDWEYWFTLDRPEDEEIVVDLHFDRETRFTLELPMQVLEQGLEIAQRLLGVVPAKRRARR